ncbi:MAG TPA: DUF6754 domain-containing protein [Levilinea sp.]|nr:DUF6754 domain-containing protein [Levilinea sp.]
MIGVEHIVGLVLLLAAAGLMFWFSFSRRDRSTRALRPLAALQRTRRAIGLSVEDGKRIHVSIGKASILSPNNASGLVGLNTADRIAQFSMMSDRPPVITSGDGSLAVLSQDTLRSTYRAANMLDQCNPHQGRLTGPTPFSYVAGTMPLMRGEGVSTNLLIGSFGPEAGLLLDSASQGKTYTLAGSEALDAQAVMYALADESLIGEEFFAAPAYLQGTPMQVSSLHVQDVLRWVLASVLLVGAIVKLLSDLYGMAF